MAFGFPAYHTEELTGTPGPVFRNALLEAIHALRWSVRDETETEITASTGVSFWSWGEKILVRLHEHGATVTSRCALVTQCFDWGKNRSNVRKLFAEFSAHQSYLKSLEE